MSCIKLVQNSQELASSLRPYSALNSIYYIYVYIYIYICEILKLDSSKRIQIFSLFQAPNELNDVLLNYFMFTYFSV